MRTKQEKEYIELIDKYKMIIYKLCRRYAGNNDELVEQLYGRVGDVLWDEYISQKTNWPQTSDDEFRWLYCVVKNTVQYVMRDIKTKAVDLQLIEDEKLDTIMSVSASEVVLSEGDRYGEKLMELVMQLNLHNQQLVFYRLEGYSYAEIAYKMDMREEAVRTAFSRLIKKLKLMGEQD